VIVFYTHKVKLSNDLMHWSSDCPDNTHEDITVSINVVTFLLESLPSWLQGVHGFGRGMVPRILYKVCWFCNELTSHSQFQSVTCCCIVEPWLLFASGRLTQTVATRCYKTWQLYINLPGSLVSTNYLVQNFLGCTGSCFSCIFGVLWSHEKALASNKIKTTSPYYQR
jgi:hypothetical protein